MNPLLDNNIWNTVKIKKGRFPNIHPETQNYDTMGVKKKKKKGAYKPRLKQNLVLGLSSTLES